MKTFTSCLAIFMAMFALANCEQGHDMKAISKKIYEKISKLNVNETRVRVMDDLKRCETLMLEAAQHYSKDLYITVNWYKSIISWSKEGMGRAAKVLDAQPTANKTHNWFEMGMAMELIRDMGDVYANERANSTKTVPATTEEVGKKGFDTKKARVLHIVKAVADMLKKAGKIFWADVHQDVYEFLVKNFKEVEDEMKKETSTSIRAKNYQQINTDLDALLEMVEFRTQPGTFFARVVQKLKDLGNKILSIF